VADSRFFARTGPFRLRELAEFSGAELLPGTDPDTVISDVAPLETAKSNEISFLDNRRYVEEFAKSGAGACVVLPEFVDRAPGTMALLTTDKPYRCYARIAGKLYPEAPVAESRHESASVDPTATIGSGTRIGAAVSIGARVEIGAGCQIEPNAVIDDGVVIGDGTRIGANASLSHCIIGRNCEIHAGVCIGNRGFGFAMDPEGFVDVPQLGRVLVEDNVEIGANSTVDRGAGPDTVIGAGCKIDNLVQIGHNVQLGQGCVLVSQSGVAGSSRLENFVVLAAQAGVAGHLTVGQGTQIAAQSGVMRDLPPGGKFCGSPAMPIRDFMRLASSWKRQGKAKDNLK